MTPSSGLIQHSATPQETPTMDLVTVASLNRHIYSRLKAGTEDDWFYLLSVWLYSGGNSQGTQWTAQNSSTTTVCIKATLKREIPER